MSDYQDPLISDEEIRREMLQLLNPKYVPDVWYEERDLPPASRLLRSKARRRLRKRRWHLANRDRRLAEMKVRYRDNREAMNEEHRRYYADNRDRIRDRQRDYWAENRDRINAGRRARRRESTRKDT